MACKGSGPTQPRLSARPSCVGQCLWLKPLGQLLLPASVTWLTGAGIS
jgi:hypothetical protein